MTIRGVQLVLRCNKVAVEESAAGEYNFILIYFAWMAGKHSGNACDCKSQEDEFESRSGLLQLSSNGEYASLSRWK